MTPPTRSARELQVPCTIDIANTSEAMFAHVSLHGIEVHAGDSVLIHDAPPQVELGAHVEYTRRATIVRAGRVRRAWTRFRGYLVLATLFEVGFSEASSMAPGRRAAGINPGAADPPIAPSVPAPPVATPASANACASRPYKEKRTENDRNLRTA